MTERTLSHFAFFSFTDAYWALGPDERARFREAWPAALRAAATRIDIYQVFPARAETDLLVWSAGPADDPAAPAAFFEGFARATAPYRALVRPTHVLWGITKPSVYSRGSSSQEIDSFDEARKPYLMVYPFAKTADWYLNSREARQGMMNEHIRIGRQYPEIKQLLLYTFGLQDHEYVVVYEADSLTQFSDLVAELRGSEARRYTSLDTPTFTAVHHSPEETLAIWG